jgi:predicted nucleic acid-binding protein
VLIGQVNILPLLFETVFMPAAVREELERPLTPPLVGAWVASNPPWLALQPVPVDDDGVLRTLDDGERAAIILAGSLGADIILMDDRAGVVAARARGFAVTGTLGLLDRAARRGLIDLATAFTALRATNFRTTAAMLRELLSRYEVDSRSA